MSINTKHFPQEVRQAINMAINRDALVNNLMHGEGVPAPGPLAPNHRYFNEELLPIPYDIEKAKQMIIDSGFDTSKTCLLYTSSMGAKSSRISSEVFFSSDSERESK